LEPILRKEEGPKSEGGMIYLSGKDGYSFMGGGEKKTVPLGENNLPYKSESTSSRKKRHLCLGERPSYPGKKFEKRKGKHPRYQEGDPVQREDESAGGFLSSYSLGGGRKKKGGKKETLEGGGDALSREGSVSLGKKKRGRKEGRLDRPIRAEGRNL